MLFAGCASTVTAKLAASYAPLNENEPIYILDVNEPLPSQSELVGSVNIGDSGFSSNCGYDKVLSLVKDNARKSGANIVQISKVFVPNLMTSSCYRMRTNIYRNFNKESLSKIKSYAETANKSQLPKQ